MHGMITAEANYDINIQKASIKKNILSNAKLISSTRNVFFNELKSLKQVLINNQFPNYIVDENIKLVIGNLDNINNNPPNSSHQIIVTKMYPNFKLNEKLNEKALKYIDAYPINCNN